jgi:hypothetical protein
VNLDSYCREIEAYLCRKNDGHLIRIAGPAFERVSRWAEDGIPITVACAGIDRYFERYYRRGPRRRPVRIEFCEADVLDAFDDWRRAVGVAAPSESGESAARRRESLALHVERAIARLTSLRSNAEANRVIDVALEHAVRQLDQLLPAARSARGAAREAVLTELDGIDRNIMDAALGAMPADVSARAEQEARAQLLPFRERMSTDAYAHAIRAATERYVREHFGLPTLSFS